MNLTIDQQTGIWQQVKNITNESFKVFLIIKEIVQSMLLENYGKNELIHKSFSLNKELIKLTLENSEKGNL